MVSGKTGDQIKITKYIAGQDDVARTCSTRLGDVIRTLVEVGATYPDVVDALHQARRQHGLQSRLVFDAVPEAGRTYHRGDGELRGDGEKSEGDEEPKKESSELASK
jgi:hypothetical protein